MTETKKDKPIYFAQKIDETYICEYCKDILSPPVRQTQCGHRLCQKCVDVMFMEQLGPVECPGHDDDCMPLSMCEVSGNYCIHFSRQ